VLPGRTAERQPPILAGCHQGNYYRRAVCGDRVRHIIHRVDGGIHGPNLHGRRINEQCVYWRPINPRPGVLASGNRLGPGS
jgi:hypothetical protein